MIRQGSLRQVLTPPNWISINFKKRECNVFIPTKEDSKSCCCGLSLRFHPKAVIDQDPSIFKQNQDEVWNSSKHTVLSPTDAFGTIEFQGSAHPTKAQYIRLSHDTQPDLVTQLLLHEWSLEPPKLLISVHGGKQNYHLQPKLRTVFKRGLLKAAKTTGAWIITGGIDTGVTRHVGEALSSERSPLLRQGRIVCIGIAPWGVVENRQELIAKNKDVQYHPMSNPKSKYCSLNSKHSYFLLVDNGTVEKYGSQILFRKKLEKYISTQQIQCQKPCTVPVVCVIVEGGPNVIRQVLEYVTDTPPVPVLVLDGSGRSADLLAFTHKYATELDPENINNAEFLTVKEHLLATIRRTFDMGPELCDQLLCELLECAKRRDMITVFRLGDPDCTELDQALLKALLKTNLSHQKQLSLAMSWNRVDIARSEIFGHGVDWPPGELEDAMMEALVQNRLDFVELLLENGVCINKFLTINRLEDLYNAVSPKHHSYKTGPCNTLTYLVRDVRKHLPLGYRYTLYDIGLVINKLMGGAYRATYCRRHFRQIYVKVMKKGPLVRHASTIPIFTSMTSKSLTDDFDETKSVFQYPFNDLLIWAVLTKRQPMAKLMWQHGEEAVAKALAATKLYKAMAHEAADDDLETEIYEELKMYAKEFETLALELVDYCYRQDDDFAERLLTYELNNWSRQTCLSLAVAANHRPLLAHPCSQILLADLWMGGIRTRKNTNLKVICCLLVPPALFYLEFRTQEELILMPQTEEEHVELAGDNSSISSDGSNYSSERENPFGSKLSMGPAKALSSSVFGSRDRDRENGYVINSDFPVRSYTEIKNSRPLKPSKKLYEFYTAPITKFWAFALSYTAFLFFYTYVVLVRMPPFPSWQEIVVISYIFSIACEKVREFVTSEPVKLSHKINVWFEKKWNICDVIAILFFFTGLVLRLMSSTMAEGRVIYCVNIIYWYIRLLDILSVNKYLGPFVMMIGKMVINMIYFVVLLLVVLMSFGVARQAILNPYEEPSWQLARNVFLEPYFMLYGEVYADSIDPPCGGIDEVPCHTGRWLTPAIMSMYLLIANILLINLLIAVFNNIFQEVNAISHQVWMFQRFTVVMEYEQKPVLPPPFILISHIYMVIKYLKKRIRGQEVTRDYGLKLFLEGEALEQIHDFEEECVEGYFLEKEEKMHQSADEKIRFTNEMVETINQKVEDIHHRDKTQRISLQTLDFRLARLEENIKNLTATVFCHQSNIMAPRGSFARELPFSVDINLEKQEDIDTEDELAAGDTAEEFDEGKSFGRSATVQSYRSHRPLRKELSLEQPSEQDAFSSPACATHTSIQDIRSEIPSVALSDSVLRVRHHSSGTSLRKLNYNFSRQRASEPQCRKDFLSVEANINVEAGDAIKRSTRKRSTTLTSVEQPLDLSACKSKNNRGSSTKVIPPVNPVMNLNDEYTSITDELESEYIRIKPVMDRLTPPKSPYPHWRTRQVKGMGLKLNMKRTESELLRTAEAQDYLQMTGLIQRRLHRNSEDLNASLEDLAGLRNSFSEDDERTNTLVADVNFIVGDSDPEDTPPSAEGTSFSKGTEKSASNQMKEVIPARAASSSFDFNNQPVRSKLHYSFPGPKCNYTTASILSLVDKPWSKRSSSVQSLRHSWKKLKSSRSDTCVLIASSEEHGRNDEEKGISNFALRESEI